MIPRKPQRLKRAYTLAEQRRRLASCRAALRAIRAGEVDALVVNERSGDRVYTLNGADTVYRVLIETMSEGAAALDRNGAILFGNRRLAEMLGRAVDQIIGAPFQSFLGEEHREIFGAQLAKERADSLSVDVALVAPDGSTRPARLSMASLGFGDVEGICLVATDMSYRAIHERALAERANELARSNAELERFAYVASHDLQEPLRMVGSFTQLLARRYQGRLDSDADEFIGFIVDGVHRMQSLITDILEYSRVGRKTRPLGPADLEEALARALDSLRGVIEETGAVIEHDPLPRVWGDQTQLLQLFQNLVANAIKFRSTEPIRVSIGTEMVDDHWVVSVRDNGIGIDPRHFDRVFVLFQRLHDRLQYPGTGIGLAVCRKIVELHGGVIWLESQPGAGACFHFTVPIRGDSPVSHEPKNRAIGILLVDDNPADVRLTIEAFKELGLAPVLDVACDGEQAVAMLRDAVAGAGAPVPDLILLDLNLPRMNGREVLAEIKADPTLRRIPVVVLTTSQAEDDVVCCYDLHTNGYVIKPTHFDRYVDVIKSIEGFWLTTVLLPTRR